MFIQGIISLWFLLTALSIAYTAYDISSTPVSWVQKLGWILVVVYTGPFGLFYYMLTCRSPGKGLHELYTQVMWKQAANSEVHCVAGDATGIILSAILLSYFTIPLKTELIIEYISAFVFGWFIFQALMMRPMYGSYLEALKKTFFAEAVSMNFVMLGMIPAMVALMRYIPHSHDPSTLHFWFAMGIATIVGSVTAYPINYWLVAKKLKHGCMTIPEKGEQMHMQHEGHSMQMASIPIGLEITLIAVSFILMLWVTWLVV